MIANPPCVLIVGCGSIGERHLRCFQSTGAAEVAACDANVTLLDRVAETYAVPKFADLGDALAARKWDALVICTPAHTHLPIALLGLEHGAHLLIEKPLAVDAALVPQVREAIAKSDRAVAIAYVYHAMPWIAAMRDALHSGDFGRPLHASFVAGQHFPTFRPAYRDIYYARHESGGGAIQDAITHLVNAMEWMLGPVTRLYADARHQALEGVEVEDTVVISARHGDVLGSYTMNQFQAPNESTLQIHCEKGSLCAQGHRQRFGMQRYGDQDWQWTEFGPLERDAVFIAQAEAFLAAMKGLPHPLATFEEAVQTLRFNRAALESARTGQPVDLA
jgi:predicted dehydrogenase